MSKNTGPTVAPPTLADAACQFLDYLGSYRRASPHTLEAYRRDLDRLIQFLEERKLPAEVQAVSTRHMQAFALSLSSLAPASVHRVLNACSSFFGFAHRQGLVERNPVAGVERPRIPQQIPRAPTICEVRALVAAAATARERCMVLLLACCGLRRSELLNLEVKDLAADLTSLIVRAGKGQQDRVVPIPEQCRGALREHLSDAGKWDGLLFTNGAGNRVGNTELYRIFLRLLRRSGLDGASLTPHSLRHYYASQLLRGRADVETVRSLCGHADLRTTARYLHSDDETRQDAVSKLPALTVESDLQQHARGEVRGNGS